MDRFPPRQIAHDPASHKVYGKVECLSCHDPATLYRDAPALRGVVGCGILYVYFRAFLVDQVGIMPRQAGREM
jgi:hypothetical protein